MIRLQVRPDHEPDAEWRWVYLSISDQIALYQRPDMLGYLASAADLTVALEKAVLMYDCLLPP